MSGDETLLKTQRERVFFTWSAQSTASPLPISHGHGAEFLMAMDTAG